LHGSRIALCLIARFARCDRVGEPPTLSSLADEKHLGSLLLSTAALDPLFDCSLPSQRMFVGLPRFRTQASRTPGVTNGGLVITKVS
jgi:hypothetical protein